MEDSTMKTQPAGISGQCRRTDRLLWEAYARSESRCVETDRCRLLFPEPEKQKLRVSEQEARFPFVEALCKAGQFRYSVETPTDKRYKFTGKHEESAQTDLTLYDLETRCRLCNVEFKAGGWSLKGGESDENGESNKSNVFPIYKDVQKLLRERPWGLWFHLLESINKQTIPNFLKVMWNQVNDVQEEFGKCAEAPGLTVHVCVLKRGFSLQKDVSLPVDTDRLKSHLQDADKFSSLLDTDLHVSPRSTLNGWRLNQRKCRPQK